MGDKYDKESSGIVRAVSKQAGAVAGTSVVISKKIAGCGVKTIVTAKDCIKRPLQCLVPAGDGDKESVAARQTSAIKSKNKQETDRKKAAKALIAALESDLAAALRDLKKAHSNAEKTQSKLASQLDELKVEKDSLLSDLEQAKSEASEAATREEEVKTQVAVLESDLVAVQSQLETPLEEEEEYAKSQPSPDIDILQPEEETVLSDQGAEEKAELVSTEQEVQPEIKPTAAQSDKQVNVKVEEQPSQMVVEQEMPGPTAVTNEEIQAAVFPNATDKIIFLRAISDIGNHDATVRVDAAKTIAGIHHELSIKALAAQMACESSAQVRRECIKALATLEMTEALPAIERALTDEAGLVRLAAVWGLYQLAGAESAPALIRMLADNDEEVRRRAATCIGWLGKEHLAVELLPLLDDNSISVRRAAVEAMSNLRSRQVVSSLIERLNDPVESIRKVVLSAIETITGKKMSKSFPKGQKEFERLNARWQQWRKEQLLG